MRLFQRLVGEWNREHREFLAHPVFLAVLAAKVLAGAVFSSYFIRDLFIPFLDFWVDSRFANPWDEFLRRGILNAFPYSSGMLYVLGIPYAIGAWITGDSAAGMPLALKLALVRLPMLVADIGIYVALCRWFEGKWKYVLGVYWCSPVLFFITYVHGQIDVIPTAFLFAALWFLVRLSPRPSGVALGFGVATKLHLVVAIALFVAYLLKNGYGVRRRRYNGVLFVASLGATVALLIGPWLGSPGYQRLVLQAKEASWVYDVAWPIGGDLQLLLAPAVCLALMLHFFSYRTHSRDLIVLYLGLIYSALILFVRPMPGWAYWSLPFLCYFLVREQLVSFVPFWTYSGFYLVYYLGFADNVAVIDVRRLIVDPVTLERFRNLALTGMQASLALLTVWVFRVSLRGPGRAPAHLAIGIGGDSGSGKHALAAALTRLLGPSNVVTLSGDDYHRWERGHAQYDELTHLNPNSNYFRTQVQHLTQLKTGLSVVKVSYDHAQGRFTAPARVDANRYIFFVGLHPFLFHKTRALMDIKIFLDTDEALRRQWKIGRDQRERGHDPATVLRQIERREADAARFVQPQKRHADWIIQYYKEEIPGPRAPDGLRARHSVGSQFVLVEQLVDVIREVAGEAFEVRWTIEDGFEYQILDVRGDLTAEQVATIAQRLVPDVEELYQNRLPAWSGGVDGLSQLIFTCILHDVATEPRP